VRAQQSKDSSPVLHRLCVVQKVHEGCKAAQRLCASEVVGMLITSSAQQKAWNDCAVTDMSAVL
jgi:hypothetical protein